MHRVFAQTSNSDVLLELLTKLDFFIGCDVTRDALSAAETKSLTQHRKMTSHIVILISNLSQNYPLFPKNP